MTAPFDPSGPADPGSGLFGLSTPAGRAAVHVHPVPFEATTSYRVGTRFGPQAVLTASHQVDLYDLVHGHPYRKGIHMSSVDPRIPALDEEGSNLVVRAREGEAEGAQLERIDAIGAELNSIVAERTRASLDEGAISIVLGGDHAVPFGAIEAHAERHSGLGILHFDAHADLRESYEGFRWSHASILHNVLAELNGVETVVQVGVRDLCQEEHEAIRSAGRRLRVLFDNEWSRARLAGENLSVLVRSTLAPLPRQVYVTFDVDGLDPQLCPNTGTPVPGGLTWGEAMLWLDELVASGRTIVGCDLVEVSPGGERPLGQGWDEIVGARLLYRLIGACLASRPD